MINISFIHRSAKNCLFVIDIIDTFLSNNNTYIIEILVTGNKILKQYFCLKISRKHLIPCIEEI